MGESRDAKGEEVRRGVQDRGAEQGRRFGKWLAHTRALQEGAYGVSPHELRGDELLEYVRWNTLAAHVELDEFLQTTDWKPWKQPQVRTRVDRNASVNELVDALHFIANLLVALKVDDDELERRYAEKVLVNERRQREGY